MAYHSPSHTESIHPRREKKLMSFMIVIVILSALVIGFLGRRHRFGFWGYFFATLLLTPLVGLLMLIAASGSKVDAR